MMEGSNTMSYKIKSMHLTIVAHGENKAIASNIYKKGQAKNRHILNTSLIDR